MAMVIRTFRRTWKVVWRGRRDRRGRNLYEKVGKPTQEVAWHVTSLAPEDLEGEGGACVERLAGHVRAHWHVEVYHGKRDNGCHEDRLTRRMDLTIMSAMMVARSLGMRVCARSPGKSTEAVQKRCFAAKKVRVKVNMESRVKPAISAGGVRMPPSSWESSRRSSHSPPRAARRSAPSPAQRRRRSCSRPSPR